MGVQIVADQRQVLGLTVARMVHYGLHLARPIHGRAPRAQRFHEKPDEAGTVPHIFIHSRPSCAGRGVRVSASSCLGCSSLQITG